MNPSRPDGRGERIGNTNEISGEERIAVMERALKTVGRSVFFSVIIMIISFSPILFLSGQEKKLFSPLVLTKTFSLVGAALLAITVAPMLTRTLVKGRLVPESRNPVSSFFVRLYTPVIGTLLNWKKTVVAACLLLLAGSVPLVMRLGSEFMPPLDEGSLLLMPVTLPDVSNTEAKRIMQVQDRMLMEFPEVDNVLGKAGRAYTATDNAPISMIETIIMLKPKRDWRPGMTTQKLIAEMNERVQIPGVVVGWTQPIINRINMLSTGIRTDVGVKIMGQDLDSIYAIAREVEAVVRDVPGLVDLYVEQVTGGKYLDIQIRREELGRYGLSVEDVNMLIEGALGGMNLTTTVEGRQRFKVGIRFAQDYRYDFNEIGRIPVQTMAYGAIPLSAVADIKITDGAPMISSEDALLRGTVLFNVRGRDMGSVVREAQQRVEAHFTKLPRGYYISWSGQYENKVRAEQRLKVIIPLVLLLIAFILYATFHSFREVLMVFIAVPVALVGGVISLYLYGANFSVAVAVGFIALFGVAVETGVLMIAYLNHSMAMLVAERGNDAAVLTPGEVKAAVQRGAVPRVRPLLMTVLANIMGMIPILAATGTGSDVMKPITIPFVFGLISSTLFVLVVLPIIFQLQKEYELKKYHRLRVLGIHD